MKTNMIAAGLFLFCLLFTTTSPLFAQSHSHKRPKKGINLALNITNKKKQPSRTYLNLGIISNYSCLNGLGINAISSVTHYHTKGLQLSGLTNITGLHTKGFQLSGIANITGRNSNGIILSGLMNVNGGSQNGFAFSGIGNMTAKSQRGVIISGLINIANERSSGMLLSGIANVSKQEQSGLMVSGLLNASGDTVRGLQLTSLLNIAGKANNGIQLAALGNINTTNRGAQIGISNYSAENKGVQIGIANIAGEGRKGLQFGIVNVSADSLSHQIGCINITPQTRVQLLISSGNLNKVNIAARFKNRYTYTELGGGAYYFDLDHDLSASAFYRAGLYYPILSRLEISADAGFYHIETLDNKHNGYPARVYALQPRLNLEYRITKKLGFFVSGGYCWTRQYKHNHTFERKGTLEAGLVLF